MKVKCRHGFFIFRESKPGDVSRFVSIHGMSLTPFEDYFTFNFLADAKFYSIKGSPYLGLTAIETYAGHPGEVMRANSIVYDPVSDSLKPIETVTSTVKLNIAAFYYFANGLIVPGSIREDGSRITDYSAHMNFDDSTVRYSEATFD